MGIVKHPSLDMLSTMAGKHFIFERYSNFKNLDSVFVANLLLANCRTITLESNGVLSRMSISYI